MKRSNAWIVIIAMFTLAVFSILTVSVFLVSVGQVHVRSGTDLSAYSENANYRKEILKANRGTIYDVNKEIIAQDIVTYNIICILDEDRPSPANKISYVNDPEYASLVLAEILDADQNEILALLTQDVYQTELGSKGRQISPEQKEEIKSYEINGIEFVESVQRYYPFNGFASHLIGYAQGNEDGNPVGMMGLELYHDDEMTGSDGLREFQADKNGWVLPGMTENVTEEINGDDVYLTLNRDLQETLEIAFLESEKIHGATKAWGSVMEVDTGKILAWGQYPSFNPNELVIDDYNNYGSQYAYEAGSVIKVLAYAAAMNEGVYNGEYALNSNAFCFVASGMDPVRTYGGDFLACIENARDKTWGNISYDQGLILSSNVASASLITEVITPTIYEEYLEDFGLFQLVDTDGIPEVLGTKNFTWPYDKLAMSYGQGSSVTMLQMIRAFSAIFSDGKMVTPYYIDSIRDGADPSIIKYQAEVEYLDQVISPESAKQIQELMRRVVYDDAGTAKHYQIPEIDIIAKTGTSELADSVDGYGGSKVISSVMVALPADDPKYLVYYAFESEYNLSLHASTDPVKGILRKVAMLNSMHYQKSSTEDESYVDIDNYEMPNFINHSVEYSNNKLEGITKNIEIIGSGKDVVKQWPKANQSLVSNQRVFLVTDLNEIIMPNMIGWSRKDVAEFWQISGIEVRLEGHGMVASQTISEGTVLNTNNVIEVMLE